MNLDGSCTVIEPILEWRIAWARLFESESTQAGLTASGLTTGFAVMILGEQSQNPDLRDLYSFV